VAHAGQRRHREQAAEDAVGSSATAPAVLHTVFDPVSACPESCYGSRAWHRLFGYSPSQLRTLSAQGKMIRYVHPADAERYSAASLATLRTKRGVQQLRARFMAADGRVFSAVEESRVCYDAEGAVVGISSTYTDVRALQPGGDDAAFEEPAAAAHHAPSGFCVRPCCTRRMQVATPRDFGLPVMGSLSSSAAAASSSSLTAPLQPLAPCQSAPVFVIPDAPPAFTAPAAASSSSSSSMLDFSLPPKQHQRRSHHAAPVVRGLADALFGLSGGESDADSTEGGPGPFSDAEDTASMVGVRLPPGLEAFDKLRDPTAATAPDSASASPFRTSSLLAPSLLEALPANPAFMGGWSMHKPYPFFEESQSDVLFGFKAPHL
jgi:hypothetical protein